MLLRISLVIAILAGLGTLYFGHFKVKERITNISAERDQAQNAQRVAEDNDRKSRAEARKAREAEETAKKELTDTKSTLENTASRLAEQEKRANQLAEDLTRTTAERNEAQQAVAVWRQIELTPDQAKAIRGQLRDVTQERDALVDENKILLRNNNELVAKLERYTGTDEVEVKLPPGLQGSVVAVDPKHDFVVLDIGGNQGVLEHGKMLINRDGKLVGKVRITRVEPNRSIANIMPDWKQTDVMEGDKVVY